MSTGLLALLDDVAALIKVSAASLDDIPTQVAKTTSKVSGIVIDDAAVTPKYVVGLDPSRELSIIFAIATRSIFNKLVFLAPGALLLGFFAPWAIQPILMLGGCYLCFEGYEKIHSLFSKHPHSDAAPASAAEVITPEALEKMRITSAVNTDLILSAEIIAITYASVADQGLLTQISVLLSIAVGITIAVYGFVGLIVKADDIGLHLAKHSRYAWIRRVGRAVVTAMPRFLEILSYIGTAAMLWVGAEIIVHGIPFLHHLLEQLQHQLAGNSVIAWAAKAFICAVGGAALGFCLAKMVDIVRALRKPRLHHGDS